MAKNVKTPEGFVPLRDVADRLVKEIENNKIVE